MGVGPDKTKALKELGSRVMKIRQSKGLTQSHLSAIIGKDQQSLQRLEAGKVNPSFFYLLVVCDGLEITISELLDFNSESN